LKKTGYCEKCQQWHELGKHHVFPRRFFRKQKHPLLVWFCARCHQGLEALIPVWDKQEKNYYIWVVCKFADLDRASLMAGRYNKIRR
jgi:hypothetical protein